MARRNALCSTAVLVFVLLNPSAVRADLLTDPNDPRSWQGATVGTFAELYYGANTPENRQKIIDDKLLDDGLFDPTGYVTATLYPNAWATEPGAGGCLCRSAPTPLDPYNYEGAGNKTIFEVANAVDDLWFQSHATVGGTVFDMGFQASKAVVFPIVDHGPLPEEVIESTVYFSNDRENWTQAVVERVWLEGYMADTNVLWDGFAYAVGTGTNATFRYLSITSTGPGQIPVSSGLDDDEINAVMGLYGDYTGFTGASQVPEPGAVALALLALGLGLGLRRARV